MSKEQDIRRRQQPPAAEGITGVSADKIDPADALDASETFLPGQIPVRDADSAEKREERATEQQPDPAEAAAAVNPKDLTDVKLAEDRNPGD
jgi:hypothetical protein